MSILVVVVVVMIIIIIIMFHPDLFIIMNTFITTYYDKWRTMYLEKLTL